MYLRNSLGEGGVLGGRRGREDTECHYYTSKAYMHAYTFQGIGQLLSRAQEDTQTQLGEETRFCAAPVDLPSSADLSPRRRHSP